ASTSPPGLVSDGCCRMTGAVSSCAAFSIRHPPVTQTQAAANQRNAVLAGFLGWTLDAFDFFILTLVIDDLAHAFLPGLPPAAAVPRIAFAITVTLAMRPIGAVVFGL